MGRTFDVFIASSGLHSSAPKSAAFVEALWRRRERVPDARSWTRFRSPRHGDSVMFVGVGV